MLMICFLLTDRDPNCRNQMMKRKTCIEISLVLIVCCIGLWAVVELHLNEGATHDGWDAARNENLTLTTVPPTLVGYSMTNEMSKDFFEAGEESRTQGTSQEMPSLDDPNIYGIGNIFAESVRSVVEPSETDSQTQNLQEEDRPILSREKNQIIRVEPIRSINPTGETATLSDHGSINSSVGPTSAPSNSSFGSQSPMFLPTQFPTISPTPKPSTVPSQEPTPMQTAAQRRVTHRPTMTHASVNRLSPGLQEGCFNIDTSRYNICLDLQVSNQDRLDAFTQAKSFWESAIVGQTTVHRGIGNVIKHYAEKGTGWATDVPTNLDDIYIAGFETPIDGPGKVLGSASPHFVNRLTKLPINGQMKFDSDDVRGLLEKDPSFWVNLIVHEMGHVLGFGTLVSELMRRVEHTTPKNTNLELSFRQWDIQGLLETKNTKGLRSYSYMGTRAQEEWEALGCQTSIPVETDGGQGTAGGHWDEQCLGDELMTGFLSVGQNSNILSRITLGSLEDSGYEVDYAFAGDYDETNVKQSCCRPSKRNLRTVNGIPSEEAAGKRRRLSPELIEIAADQAAKEMFAARTHPPTEIPDDLEFVGGDVMKIFMLGDDGITVEDVTFHWDEVKHRL